MLRFITALLLALALATPASAHLRFQVFVTGSAVSDNDNSPASPSNITGLAWPAIANVPVLFRCKIITTATGAGQSVRFDITGPAVTAVTFQLERASTGPGNREYDTVTALSTLTAVGTSLATASVATLEGVLRPSADGTFQVRIEPEVDANAVTAEIGSVCEYSYER